MCCTIGNGDSAGGEGAFFPYEALVEGREWPAAVDPSHRERCVPYALIRVEGTLYIVLSLAWGSPPC